MSITNNGQIHIVQNQDDSAPNTTHILVNTHKKYSGPRHKDTNSSVQHNGEKTTHTHTHTHTHTRNKNSQTPKKLRKNTRQPLPCKYYLPTTLDKYKQRHIPQRFTHFLILHTCSLSHRKPNALSLRPRTHSKTLEADQPLAEKKFRTIRRMRRRIRISNLYEEK